jgi:hypothetical protein
MIAQIPPYIIKIVFKHHTVLLHLQGGQHRLKLILWKQNMRANSRTDNRDEATLDELFEESAIGGMLRHGVALVLLLVAYASAIRVLDYAL